ncbi:MAG: tetratricopeptide repeat protein [Cyclobacteriaceae bacterium]
MDSTEQRRRLARRYSKWAIACCFLLALLWPLGNFVFWIMLGLITYFFFLSFYYRPKAKPVFERKNSTSSWGAKQQTGASAKALFERMKMPKPIRLLIVIGGLALVLMVLIPNLSSRNSDDDPPSLDKSVNIDSLVDLGNERYNRGEYESALGFYEKALQADPTNQFGLYNKALVYYSKKEYRKSISLIRYCIEKNPEYGPAYYLLGDDYKFINQRDSAHIFFEKAYDLGARDSGLLQNLGDISYDKKETDNAIQFYKEAIEQDTTLVYIYERLAELEPSEAENYRGRAALVKK